MRTVSFFLLLLLSAPPSRGDENIISPKDQVEPQVSKPVPQFTRLDQALRLKQEAHNSGQLTFDQYQTFITKFRVELDAALASLPPTPKNKGLYAQILAHLGTKERTQALNGLTKALEKNPGNALLLCTQGQIYYEQRDFRAASDVAWQAWEASGRKDRAAWALLKMSEGRVSPGKATDVVFNPNRVDDYSQSGWPIPTNHDIAPQVARFVQQAMAARSSGESATAWSNAQAAMNADPTSIAVQKFYETMRVEHVQDIRRQSSEIFSKTIPDLGKDSAPGQSPLLPLLAVSGVGLTAFGLYKVALSRGVRSSDEGLNPSPEVSSEQIRRNYINSAVLIGAPIVIAALVYGGPPVWRAAAPTVALMLRNGQQAIPDVATSEAGAIFPKATNESSRLLSEFSATEAQVIEEAQRIMDSPQFVELRSAYYAGRPIAVNIGGRVIRYEPSLPMSGMTSFQERGFVMGQEAFSSNQETAKTVLHELHRLATSGVVEGATRQLATEETNAAFTFSERAAQVLHNER